MATVAVPRRRAVAHARGEPGGLPIGRALAYLALVLVAIIMFVPFLWSITTSLKTMWVPFMVDAFGVFLMRQFFQSIPYELEEAARIDGASRFRMFWQVILPLALPAVATLCIFAFQGSWNNFLDALIFISGSNRDIFTLPLGLA